MQHVGLGFIYLLGIVDQITTKSGLSEILILVTGGLIIFLYGLVRDSENRSQRKLDQQRQLYESQIKGIQDFYERSLGVHKDKKNDSIESKDKVNPS